MADEKQPASVLGGQTPTLLDQQRVPPPEHGDAVTGGSHDHVAVSFAALNDCKEESKQVQTLAAAPPSLNVVSAYAAPAASADPNTLAVVRVPDCGGGNSSPTDVDDSDAESTSSDSIQSERPKKRQKPKVILTSRLIADTAYDTEESQKDVAKILRAYHAHLAKHIAKGNRVIHLGKVFKIFSKQVMFDHGPALAVRPKGRVVYIKRTQYYLDVELKSKSFLQKEIQLRKQRMIDRGDHKRRKTKMIQTLEHKKFLCGLEISGGEATS